MEMTVSQFLEALSGKAAVPGGGSVAALCGSLSAALGSMAANLTSGKKKYAQYQEDIERLLAESQRLCREFEELMEQDAAAFLSAYCSVYSEQDDRQRWFERIKELCPPLGFAAETKEYRQNPERYRGSAGDLSTVLRIAVTGRRNTPDLCSIMQVLGRERCLARIDAMLAFLSEKQ